MMNTFVTLFWRREVLRDTTEQLAALGYDIVIDATAWRTEQHLHHDMAAALNFPSHYGNNLNALNDCLSDVGSGDYGVSESATGLALVLIGYDKFAAAVPDSAYTMLDIFARQVKTCGSHRPPNDVLSPVGQSAHRLHPGGRHASDVEQR